MKDTNIASAEVEQQFRDWLSGMRTENGIRKFTDTAIIAYCHTLRRACYKIEPYIAGNLFQIYSELEFDGVYEKILNSYDFEQVDKESGNGTFSTALKLYQAFLRHDDAAAIAIAAPSHLNTSTSSEGDASQEEFYFTNRQENGSHVRENTTESSRLTRELEHEELPLPQSAPARAFESRKRSARKEKPEPEEDQQEVYRYTEVPMTPIQKIYYGAPGTGKSYSVNQMLAKIYPQQADRDTHCRRMIFHPTYAYEDFVGSVKPLTTPDKPLDYVFVPGPFTVLLKDAFMHPYETYYLVIEEINRGNAPAIFGDLFQLLDRQSSGKSAYAIQNNSLVTYFSRDPGLKNLFSDGKIWLPANFNILATMNTADENIFILDNAFKRRFSLEYVPIVFDDVPSDWSKTYEIFKGTQPLVMLFQNTPLEDYAEMLDHEGKLVRNWPTFARLTNKLIDLMNKQAIQAGNIRLTRIPENKKLGVFFLNRTDLIRRESFINKVIFYLKQDVFPSSDRYLTDSFEEIFEKYRNEDYDIFELLR